MRAHCRRSRAGARLRAMFGIQELLRRAKFATVKASRRLVNSGDLATFAHLVGLCDWLDRAAIDLVIDVGANVGQFASALRYMGYRGDILSFEPIPRAYAALAHRMRGDRRWTGQQLAIGDSPGEATLNVMAETVFSSFLNRVSCNVNPSDTVRERLTVKVETLAHIIDAMNLARRLQYTLLKSDTQGHDMAVLQGLGAYLQEIKLVQCELSSIPIYRDAPYLTQVIDFLNGQSFKSVSFSPVNGDAIRPAEFDYLCVNTRLPDRAKKFRR